MRIKNITGRKILLNLSTKVWLRPDEEKEVNSAQRRFCELAQTRGMITILGEPDRAAVEQKRADIAASQVVEEAAPEVVPEAAPEVVPEAVEEVLEELVEEEQMVKPDLDSLNDKTAKELKIVADGLGISSGKSKKALLKAIKEYYE